MNQLYPADRFPDPVLWNLDRALEHMRALLRALEGRKVPRAFRVEAGALERGVASLRGSAVGLEWEVDDGQ